MSRLLQQVRDQVFDKTSRNRVESVSKACRKPARTCRKPGCKIKCGAADLPRRPIAEKFLHGSIEPANACQLTKFQLSSSIRGVPKFDVGATSPLPYTVRWNFYVCSMYLARSNSVPNFSIVYLCIMQLCGTCICRRFSILIMCPKIGFLVVFRVKMSKYCVVKFCVHTNVQTNKEKMSVNFGYIGRSNPWGRSWPNVACGQI